MADALISLEEGAQVTTEHKEILLIHSGHNQTLIDRFEVMNSGRRILWIKPAPEAIQARPVKEELFERLHQNTTVHEPYNEAIRRNMFGPSVVTLLTRRFMERPKATSRERLGGQLRSLILETQAFFKGEVTTSTTTRGFVLPPELAEWLRRNDVQPTESDKRNIGGHLNRGWGVMLAILKDSAPSEDDPARLGPFRYTFKHPRPVYPQLLQGRSYARRPTLDFYLISGKALVASAYPTVWNERSWESQPLEPGTFLTTYNGALHKEGEITFELEERQGLSLPSPARLVRTRFKRPIRDGQIDLEFKPAQRGIDIPDAGARGTGRDVFLCILLGLTPLLYTPESWFFLWLTARAKARARAEGSAFGVRLWALYAFAVAFYWFATQQNYGRLASVIPMLIGIGQLALPYTERDPLPVRAQFKKKKK